MLRWRPGPRGLRSTLDRRSILRYSDQASIMERSVRASLQIQEIPEGDPSICRDVHLFWQYFFCGRTKRPAWFGSHGQRGCGRGRLRAEKDAQGGGLPQDAARQRGGRVTAPGHLPTRMGGDDRRLNARRRFGQGIPCQREMCYNEDRKHREAQYHVGLGTAEERLRPAPL